MKCPRCGNEIPEGSKFCTVCGLPQKDRGQQAARRRTGGTGGRRKSQAADPAADAPGRSGQKKAQPESSDPDRGDPGGSGSGGFFCDPPAERPGEGI